MSDAADPSRKNPRLGELIAERLEDSQRRTLLQAGGSLALLSLTGGFGAVIAACGGGGDGVVTPPVTPDTPGIVPGRPTALGFQSVAKSLADALSVPVGYTARVLLRTGDPLATSVPEYSNLGTDTAESFQARFGDCGDGMQFFGIGSDARFSPGVSDRAVLAVNHEYMIPTFLHANGPTVVAGVRTVPSEVQKEFHTQGVSFTEVIRGADNSWSYRKDSSFNRRVDTATDILLSGPAGATSYMITKYSPNGSRTRGTVSNCGHGHTPWGTHLTCEENWAAYFRRIAVLDDSKRTAKEIASFARYGVQGEGRELWATVTPDTVDNAYGRWNAMVLGSGASADYRNVANTFGWVVEIDPFAPASTPRKRTALGRFAHEGAWPARAQSGKPLVWYMGCDAQNEYIYKYVSSANWDPADVNGGMAAGDKYLDSGKLYVAKFNADGSGNWLELSLGRNGISSAYAPYPFADQADVLINARFAADAAGGTRMDRPEWAGVDPLTGAVYMTLTNNASRTLSTVDAANPRYYKDRSQSGNPNGHIIRWLESSDDPAAATFRWDIFLFGARANADSTNVNVSGLTAENDFSSPDSLYFSPATKICWIHTDDYAYTDVTNCMTLAALPGYVGDGTTRTITNTDASGGTKQVRTSASYPLGARLKRFLVGPVQCEMSGFAESPDGRALFVHVMHPGESTPASSLGNPSAYTSHWPDGGAARPRSATVVITRNDGGQIGV
jgi:hypothetical protein